MRTHNRMIAYKMEFCPNYEPVWNNEESKYYIFFSNTRRVWSMTCYDYSSCALGVIYFPEDVATDLVKKLNSGEVEF